MRAQAFVVDENDRSTWRDMVLAMTRVGEAHAESERLPGASWQLALSQPGEPVGGGPHEMHAMPGLGLVWVMGGHGNFTTQDGETRRLGAGEAIVVHAGALHHSSFAQNDGPTVTLSIQLPPAVGRHLAEG